MGKKKTTTKAAPPSGVTKFICARYPSLKVTITPARILMKDNGVTVPVSAKRAEFERGLIVTDDKDIIARLRRHMWFGIHITEITSADEAKIKKQARIEAEVRVEVEKRIADEESGKTVSGKTAAILDGEGKTRVKGGTKGTK